MKLYAHFYRACLLYTQKTEMSNVKGVFRGNFTETISVITGTKVEVKGNGGQLFPIKSKNQFTA